MSEVRETYAKALAIASVQVIAAAHRGEDIRPFVTRAMTLTPPADVDKTEALIAVIAAQVDPDTTLTERLSWTNQLDPDVIAACARAAS